MANSGERELITYSKRIFWAVMPLVVNCASTWANQTSGSAGQKGGSLMLTAATVERFAAAVTGVTSRPAAVESPTVSIVALAGVAIVGAWESGSPM